MLNLTMDLASEVSGNGNVATKLITITARGNKDVFLNLGMVLVNSMDIILFVPTIQITPTVLGFINAIPNNSMVTACMVSGSGNVLMRPTIKIALGNMIAFHNHGMAHALNMVTILYVQTTRTTPTQPTAPGIPIVIDMT